MVTRLWAGQTRVQNPITAGDFLISKHIQTGSGAQCIPEFFLRDKAAKA
jgi:hypothetical protein